MDTKRISRILAELGNEHRLGIFRLLVQHADDGLTVGEIQARVGLPASTLAFHLRGLAGAGLIVQEKVGRSVVNRPSIDTLERALSFVRDECCSAGFAQSDAA